MHYSSIYSTVLAVCVTDLMIYCSLVLDWNPCGRNSSLLKGKQSVLDETGLIG